METYKDKASESTQVANVKRLRNEGFKNYGQTALRI